MALKTERTRIRFKDIESVQPFEPVRQPGKSTLLPEPPANEERGMSSHPLSVGDELRRAREEAGLDLADVAAHLRIRSNFLSALEEGHPDALPGITYAIGYVRTYAAFLGLEPDVAVRRFKEEAAGLNSKTQLVFPSPAPEGRVPGLVLMLVAAVLVGGAYGGWYWVSERDGSLRDLVPAVPERLAQLIEGEAPSLLSAGEPRPAGTYAAANPTGITVPSDAPVAATPNPTSPASPGSTALAGVTPPAVASQSVASQNAASQNAASQAAAPSPATATPQTAATPAATPAIASLPAVRTPAAETAPQVMPQRAPAPPTVASPVRGGLQGGVQAGIQAAAAPDPAPTMSPPMVSRPAAVGTGPAEPAAQASAGLETTARDDTPDVTAPPEPAAATAPTAATAAASVATSSSGTAASEAVAPSVAFPAAAVDEVPAAPRIASLIGASEAAVPPGRTAAGPIDRVMIRATGDSWVQVRDAQGTALFTRVLREGDIYRVPEQAGLRLATGNAGALQILVDGNPAPSLGDFGQVVRNVLLDPTRLAAGTAIGNSR